MSMTFELWLFTIKRLGQTYDAAIMIYRQLSEDRKDELKKEYDAYIEAKGDN